MLSVFHLTQGFRLHERVDGGEFPVSTCAMPPPSAQSLPHDSRSSAFLSTLPVVFSESKQQEPGVQGLDNQNDSRSQMAGQGVMCGHASRR